MSISVNSVEASSEKVTIRFQTLSCAVAIWSVLAMGLHLWPVEGRHTLEMYAPVNLGIILWVFMAAAAAVLSIRTRQVIVRNVPDAGVWALLAVAAASVAFSLHVGQSVAALAKLALMYVGAYTLFGVACGREGWADRICAAALAAACIAMVASIVWRVLGHEGLGFFASSYKYGTVTSILFVLGSVYLALKPNPWAWLIVPAAALAAIAVVSLGGLFGIVAGLLAGILSLRQKQARMRLVIGLLTMAIVVVTLWQTPALSALRSDTRIGETNGRDLRQRYIEWEAELNLLQERPVSGTGLGCVNDYRSMYYDRLPKLNTLQAFDYNGWLLIIAETGILGLVAFTWLIVSAGRKAWLAARMGGPQSNLAVATFAALVAACVANTFSSVNYNGVINAFVLVLAMAHHAAPTARGMQGHRDSSEAGASTRAIVPLAKSWVCDE